PMSGFSVSIGLPGRVSDDGLPIGELTLGWSQVTGPAPVTFSSTTSAPTTATFIREGIYVLRLSAYDGELYGADEVMVVVAASAINLALQVTCGPDTTLRLPANGQSFSCTVVDDGRPSGSTVQSSWVQLLGPAPVTFGTPGASTTTATFPVAGTYVIALEATDGELTGADVIRVTVIPDNLP